MRQESAPAAANTSRMTSLMASVEQAVSDAAAAVLRAEMDREAARTALQQAEDDLCEATQVLERLSRLRDRLQGERD
jgi:NACalpha-BTF3-like transcription factor